MMPRGLDECGLTHLGHDVAGLDDEGGLVAGKCAGVNVTLIVLVGLDAVGDA